MRKPEWPGIATAVGICLILAIVIACYTHGTFETAYRWQALIAASLGVGGVIFTATITVRNVAKQIKISVYSREEDRIE
ncbi:hypothetical protein, partial [Tardiphaga sp. P5_C10]